MALDAANKVVTFADGSQVRYQKLLSTVPLDQTLRWLGKPDLAARLTFSSTHIVGLGLRGASPHGDKCWMYYPESDCPYYRCTVFSHYAQKNAPSADVRLPTQRLADAALPVADRSARPGPYWSLMFEVSESRFKPVDPATVVEETIRGALSTKMVAAEDEIVSIYYRRFEYGYPTPCLERDAALAEALPWLRAQGIWSRGRFGSWKYEVGNQDHSCMIGVEAADNMLFGAKEFTLLHPSLTNEGGAKNRDMTFP